MVVDDVLGGESNATWSNPFSLFVFCLLSIIPANSTSQLYPSADSVVLLDALDLALVRVLAFADVVPAARDISGTISTLTVDPAMNLIVASMANYLAAWSLSQVQKNTWLSHSSLILQNRSNISAIDCLLAVACTSSLSVYTLILENDLPTWSQKWSSSFLPTPSFVRFSPSLMCMATITQQDNLVRIYLTTSGRQLQAIPHPLPVTNLTWRQAQKNTRDDLILYTVTSDATLRVFMPVIDSPRYLQLHASLDLSSALPYSVPMKVAVTMKSSIFWLDRQVVADSLASLVRKEGEEEDARMRRARDIKEEGWDLFLRVLSDGSLVVNALANVDRRPPTLLSVFTLLQSYFPLQTLPTSLTLISNPSRPSLPTLITSPPLASFSLSPADFFDARQDGLTLLAQLPPDTPLNSAHITRFVRTPEGLGVAAIRTSGGETWTVREHGAKLVSTTTWRRADHVIVLDRGRTIATLDADAGVLTLHSNPPCTLSVPPLTSLFTLPPSSPGTHTCIYGLTPTPTTILHIHAILIPEPSLTLQSATQLPLVEPPALIVPVDPMAWSWEGGAHGVHDVLLSVGKDGELGFWIPDGGAEVKGKGKEKKEDVVTDENEAARRREGWKRTGTVRTGRAGISMALCSSAKKTALVVPGMTGSELTIWDSKESQFASGLEYTSAVDEVRDLDWSATPDGQSILAVGFARRIEVLCQQRATYFEEDPGWALVWQINFEGILPHPISDSIWLAQGTLLIGSGHQMLLYGYNPKSSKHSEHLFEHVARRNGPLIDFHPQMVLQCLLWEKLDLVKEIIVNLARDVERLRFEGDEGFVWTTAPSERFLGRKQRNTKKIRRPGNHRRQYSSLFDEPDLGIYEPSDDPFSRELVEKLLEHLEMHPLPHLTPNEHAHLLVLIQATLEVDEARRALDANGLRYLITMRSFYILNQRARSPSSPGSDCSRRQGGYRERMRYRDIVWAFHSESQGMLLNACTTACRNKMTWGDARALGVFMWLTSSDIMKTQFEAIARNEYMAGDARDPVACSLFYFALGKHKLVHGLWRQAAWHKEQQAMLKFLANDFNQPRWRTAANKNAFALLSKQRFEYAAAFFLLGGSLKDAVNVCLRSLDDFQLAIALARIVEGDEGPVLTTVLETKVVPEAFRTGNRYLGSWAFWMLRRRDLAVRILVTPLQDIANELSMSIREIGSPHYDDPSLALLFSQLKAKTLQAAKGTSEIAGSVEFDFVLQIARVFVRMGCHILAVDLLRSWSFDRPSTVDRDPAHSHAPPSPITSRFALEPALRRRASIMIDMDVSTQPPTRRASPTRPFSPLPEIELPKPEGDLVARKAGMGSLIKTAKQNVQVPEFDMNAFF
ncbi:WD repeat-containing protein [Vararia minispora EC-137]|uniref:WD repeat-containing protein n=1 Tax=Vararia minispora EC-137 TaxID=1314806 RepID=A0ACB8QZD5_9AGAM|nr:WD repeat-containing protein [Vararia minispora EC-137]